MNLSSGSDFIDQASDSAPPPSRSWRRETGASPAELTLSCRQTVTTTPGDDGAPSWSPDDDEEIGAGPANTSKSALYRSGSTPSNRVRYRRRFSR